ncbi:hypothetical protein S7711_07708 [Stachybotrys chartarum IBT 7711]|uniref:Cytochrome P450 n=1 Tax=Stachybotrys chartarum (strain CBS 109288 / IBT 7711) TaxID=1280523 RepID=A0A084B7Y2_STACB|nr:hypothetical protein S7711_07708 [Stachybotrys chartarum IBT 7711]
MKDRTVRFSYQGSAKRQIRLPDNHIVCLVLGMISSLTRDARCYLAAWPERRNLKQRDQHPDIPIHTLRIPGARLYVVNSAALIPLVQRQWRTLIFPPIQARAAKTAMDASKEALGILCDDMTTEEGFLPKYTNQIYPTPSSGAALDDLVRNSMEVVIRTMDKFASQGTTTVKLNAFVTKQIFYATTDANTSPTAFWTVYCIFSNPTALEECRKEVSQAVTRDGDFYSINSSIIKNSCPILVSTFQEVFRVHGMANSVRIAAEDHMLDSKYLIKKGGLIMIPGRVQHTDRDVWGNDWNHFNHRRFLRRLDIKRPNPIAFRGFGGGTTLCPGRHFATAEILLFAAFLIMRFDMQPVAGQWILPTTDKSSQAEAMEQPDEDVQVKLVPRPGGGKEWRIAFSESTEPQITAEDTGGDPH